ncbi:hypothetical protein D3C73_1373100 [compost metagenome]
MLRKLFTFHIKPLLHEAADEISAHMKAVNDHINFRPVTGGNDDPFQHALGLHQLMKRRRQILLCKCELLSHLNGSRTVIQADDDDMHRLFTILVLFSGVGTVTFTTSEITCVKYITSKCGFLQNL